MAGVKVDILANMMRVNLNNLKSFAEQVNAELTEEGQEDETRQSHRANVSQILQKFGEAEAFFEKGVKCLGKVEMEVERKLRIEENGEDVVQSTLYEEIRDTIRIIEGKEKTAKDADELVVEQLDDHKVIQVLEKFQDVFNEYHPLKMDDGEEDDSDEEDRMCQELENMQKKAMHKMEKSLTQEGDHEASQEELEELDESDEEEPDVNITAHSFERVEDGRRRRNIESQSDKINDMFNEYKRQLIDAPLIDAKELFSSKLSKEPDLELTKLPFFSKYNNAILELFSKEAVVVVQQKSTYMDPISKKSIHNPVRNKKCDHIYERSTMVGLFQKKKTMSCPFMGCSNRSFTLADLEEDEELAAKITQDLARAQLAEEEMDTDREDEDMEEVASDDDTQTEEVNSDDDTQLEEVHSDDDTQSQEIL